MAREQYQKCIDACTRCAEGCSNCCDAPHEEGVADRTACMRFDCAQICRLAVELMNRDSEFVKEVCGVCATICVACAEENARLADGPCQRCAELCRLCAEECRAIQLASLSPADMRGRWKTLVETSQ